MKVVVTGGTGMIGRKLISSLLATPELIDRDGNKSEVTSITAFDVMPPDPPLPDDDRLSVVTGEISNAEAIASLICDDTDAVFHLAAVVSAQAEEDFDLGMRVNLDGTRIVLERCRALGAGGGKSGGGSGALFLPCLDLAVTPARCAIDAMHNWWCCLKRMTDSDRHAQIYNDIYHMKYDIIYNVI